MALVEHVNPRAEQPAALQGGSPDSGDLGLFCVQCGYNLTGLTRDRCPECGWHIDWQAVRAESESRRMGTPVHRARKWRKIDQTAVTVLLMLLTPWRFARQLRSDESFLPGIAVVLASFVIFYVPEPRSPAHLLTFVIPVVLVNVGQSLCFATLNHRWHGCHGPGPGWIQRLRLWLMVSCYSTCFVASWRLAGEPPWTETLTESSVWTPFAERSAGGTWFSPRPEPGPTLIFYWWATILTVFFVIRNRPRWLAVIVPVLLYLFSWGATMAGMRLAELLYGF